MPTRTHVGRSQLFTVRVWPEEIGEGHVEWRGRVQYVANGETLYFHDWQVMLAFVQATLDAQIELLEKREGPTDEPSV